MACVVGSSETEISLVLAGLHFLAPLGTVPFFLA